MLLISCVLWATTFPAMRWLVSAEGAALSLWLIIAVRFLIATGITIAWSPAAASVRGHGREWLASLWLGALLTVAFVTQTEGLKTTTASKSAFITALFVVFVPLLQRFHLRQPLPRSVFVSVPLALIGMALLTGLWDARAGRFAAGDLVIGDLWTLGCAAGYSLYIVELQRLSPGANIERLLLGQMLLMAVLGVAFTWLTGVRTLPGDPRIWLLLVYLAIFCTFGGTFLHNRFQRDTTPARAALIFTVEPVIAALIAWATLGEGLAWLGWLGAAMILGAIVVTELRGH